MPPDETGIKGVINQQAYLYSFHISEQNNVLEHLKWRLGGHIRPNNKIGWPSGHLRSSNKINHTQDERV